MMMVTWLARGGDPASRAAIRAAACALWRLIRLPWGRRTHQVPPLSVSMRVMGTPVHAPDRWATSAPLLSRPAQKRRLGMLAMAGCMRYWVLSSRARGSSRALAMSVSPKTW